MIDAFSNDKLTLEQVAEQFNLTTQTINNWRKRGLPTISIGRTVYTTKTKVNEFLNQTRNEKRPVGRPVKR